MKWINSFEGDVINVSHIECFRRIDVIVKAFTSERSFIIFKGHSKIETQQYFERLTNKLYEEDD